MRISDLSSDVCSSDLMQPLIRKGILSSFLVKPINFEIHVLAKYLSSKIPPLIIMSLFVAVVFNFLDLPIDIYINFFTSCVLVSRSEERRVGKECVSPCRSGCSPYP